MKKKIGIHDSGEGVWQKLVQTHIYITHIYIIRRVDWSARHIHVCYVFFRLFRDVSQDAMEEDCRILGIKLFFTTDALTDA